MALRDAGNIALSTSFLVDIAVGVFLVAAALDASFNTVGLTASTFPHVMVGLCTIGLGVISALSGLVRFPITDTYVRCVHRFAGKSLLFFFGAALVFALEPGMPKLTWRGIVAIALIVLAVVYLGAAFASRSKHPRPLIYCGEAKSPRPATPFVREESPRETAGGLPAARAATQPKPDNPFRTSPVPSSWPDQ